MSDPKNYYLHHAEQMEAARQEFDALWKTTIFPDLNQLVGVDPSHDPAIQRLCWTAFLHAKGLAK